MPISIDDLFHTEEDRLNELTLEGNDLTKDQALNDELKTLNLYEVAATVGKDRDPAYMGEIETMLRNGDTQGLEARLGPDHASRLQGAFQDIWKQVQVDKQITRTTGEAVVDTAVSIPAAFANTYYAIDALTDAPFSKQAAANTLKDAKLFNEFLDENVYSDKVKIQRNLKSIFDKQDERVHTIQADREAEIATKGNDDITSGLGAWGKRVVKDIGSSVVNTGSNPTVLIESTAQALASMGEAAIIKGGLDTIGKGVLKSQLIKLGAKESLGAIPLLGTEALDEFGKSVVKGLTRKGLEAGLERATIAGSNAILEGTSAYQEVSTDILFRPIEELEKSADFRKRVAELKAEHLSDDEANRQARYWLANKAGLTAAGLTGALAAGVSDVIGDPGIELEKLSTGSVFKDALHEGIEEFGQGITGAVSRNNVIQKFVNPNQDILEGVGTEAGSGALLGILSAGGMKSPNLIAQAPGTAFQVTKDVVQNISDKRLAKVAADSQVSAQNLAKNSESLFQNSAGRAELMENLSNHYKDNQEGFDKAQSKVTDLVTNLVVSELPESFKDLELTPEQKTFFTSEPSRPEAITTLSTLLTTEKDQAKKAKLAVALSDLLEPVREFKEMPSEFESLTQNAEAMKTIGEYRNIFVETANIPIVKEAIKQSKISFEKAEIAEITPENIETPEGKAAVQTLVAQATLDPRLTGKDLNTTINSVNTILTHKTSDGGDGGMSPKQRRILEGSLALLKTRQEFEKTNSTMAERVSGVLKRHLVGEKNQKEVGRELAIDQSPIALEDGKYSARQHTDRIIQAAASGNMETAKGYAEHFAKLVQHQFNKLEAINKSFQGGKGERIAYQQLQPNGTFESSTNNEAGHKYTAAFFQPNSNKSLNHAQTVAAEADLLFKLASALNDAYNLKVEMPTEVKLDSKLTNLDKFESKPAKAVEPKAEEKPKDVAEKVSEAIEKKLVPEEIKATPVKAEEPQQKPTEPSLAPAKPVEVPKTEPKKTQTEAEIVESVIQNHPDKTESISFLVRKFFGLNPKEQLNKLYLDTNTGGLNARAFEDLPTEPDDVIAHISIEGTKFINDTGGHNKGNDLYREAGRALSVANPLIAKVGGDFAIRVKNQTELNNILKVAQAEGKLHGLKFTGALGLTLKEASDNHAEIKKALEVGKVVDGKQLPPERAPRGQRPLGFTGDVKETQFGDGSLAAITIPENLAQKFNEQIKNPTKLFQRVFIENVTRLFTGEAFHDLERKAYQASIDLNWLKQINTLGEVNGDIALMVFGALAHELGGLEVDFAHVSGDEYLAQSNDPVQLKKFLDHLTERALKTQVELTDLNTNVPYTLSGLLFGKGIGPTHELAEQALNEHKQQLEKAGLRGIHAETAFKSRLSRRDAGPSEAGTQVQSNQDQPSGSTERTDSRDNGSSEQVEPKTLAETYPNLYEIAGKFRNFFKEVFKLKENTTKFGGVSNPVSFIKNTIADQIGLPEEVRKAYAELLNIPTNSIELANAAEKLNSLKEEKDKLYALKTNNQLTEAQATRLAEVLKKLKDPKTGKNYTIDNKLFHNAGGVMARLQKNLDSFLSSKSINGNTWEEAIRNGEIEATIKLFGKALNIVELGPDGKFKYNQQLIEQATLAALQWQLTASQREVPFRDEDLAEDLGIENVDGIPDNVRRAITEGESLDQAKLAIANSIRRYWGVSPDNTKGIGLTEGIPEGLAAEMLRAMEDLKMVKATTTHTREAMPNRDDIPPRTYIRYTSQPLGSKENPIYGHPELIEKTSIVEPELVSFYDETPVPVIKTQLGNPKIITSEKNQTARKNMQEQKFFMNLPMYKAVTSIGNKGMVSLFGHELPEDSKEANTKYNKNDLAAKRGKNNSIRGAMKEVERVYKEMSQIAKDGDITKVGKKYQYVTNSVNRIMMVGAHNPQASKIMREIMLSTWSKLDVSSDQTEHYKFMMLAVSQALGQKVHKKAFETNVEWAHNVLNKELVPVLSLLQNWLKDQAQPFPAEQFKKLMEAVEIPSAKPGAKPDKVDLTPLSLMTLMEVAKMKNLTGDALKSFETSIYLESDGMTNGPFNAMGLLSVGAFTPEWIKAVRRGGLAFSDQPKTANSMIDVDNYQSAMKAAETKTNQFRTQLTNQQNQHAVKLADSLYAAMSLLVGKELKLLRNSEGNLALEFDRALGKNPMTVLIYGSGNKGIANKLTHKLTTAFYEKLSILTRHNGNWEVAAQEMFPSMSSNEAVKNAYVVKQALETLTTNKIVYSREHKEFVTVPVTNANKQKIALPFERLQDQKSANEYEFKGPELTALQHNMQKMLVDPMRQGIEEVLGSSVFESGELLAQATQVQSMVARHMYMEAIQDKINERVELLTKSLINKGMDWVEADAKASAQISSEFLSKRELDQIWEDLKDVMPLVSSDSQDFLVAKNELLTFWDENKEARDVFQYSRSLDEKRRTRPNVKGIANAEVAAIPYLTIGMGDARMVREIFQKFFANSMQVFDGINIPVNKISEYGKQINEAALTAWKGNVFKDVSETFNKFIDSKQFKELTRVNPQDIGGTLIEDIADAFHLKDDVNPLLLAESLKFRLEDFALQMEARQNVLNRYALSMDQMAGTYQPHVSKGLAIPQEIQNIENQEERDTRLAELLSNEFAEELNKLKKQNKPFTVFSENRRHSSGAYVVPKSAIRDLPSMFKDVATENEIQILGEIVRSGSFKDTKIVAGTRTQVSAYQQAKGLTSLAKLTEGKPTQTINGFYSPNEKTIYLMNSDPEILIHELIHASTYETVQAYYEGKDLGAKGTEAKAAIQRLEGLMKIFMGQDFEGLNEKYTKAFLNAKNEINGHLPVNQEATAQQKAAALNEFMAWTLANREIANTLSRQETPSTLVKLAKEAYTAIKKLIWGRKMAPKFGTDIASQIRFNTAIISRVSSGLSLASQIQANGLAHATLNGTEEEVTSLGTLRDVFARKIANHLDQIPAGEERIQAEIKKDRLVPIANEAAIIAQKIFDMSDEARSAFQNMVLAFTTEAKINPQSMIEAQKLYDHFLETVDYNKFLTENQDENVDTAQAKEKFDFLAGHIFQKNDLSNRSTLLPVFVALAMTNDTFREVLAKTELAKKETPGIVGLDTAIEVAGHQLLDKLESHLTSTNKPANMRVAIDQLVQGLVKETLLEKETLEEKLGIVNQVTNNANAKIVSLMQKASNKAIARAPKLRQSNSKFDNALGSALTVFSVLTSRQNSIAVFESIREQIDRAGGTTDWAKELVFDFMQRLPSQATIYDKVKQVRVKVAQVRQDYRERVPALINSKFKQKLGIEQAHSLFKLMGKYDMAALLESRSANEVLELANNKQALAQEITRLENVLKTENPKYFAQYEVKINQYVEFVQTGVRKPNLLRNAYAIAELLGESRDPKNWVNPSAATFKAIDQLISLKLIDQAEAGDLSRFTNLMTSEREGLEFMLNYLQGLRKGEIEKARTGLARYNHYKGFMSTQNRNNGHVRVALDSEHEKMTTLGYTRMGKYTGSTLKAGDESKSYYFSPDSGIKTAFSQGIAQNVQHTAYGVHLGTGRSLESSAGLITDPVEVAKLAKRMSLEAAGPENLSPVYDPKGKIVAFEQSMDPKYNPVEQKQHIAGLMGEWAGRQVEEVFATQINQELVNALRKMYEDDIEANPKNQDQYIDLVNLSEDEDPVIRDALSIFPHHLRVMTRNAFQDHEGKPHFYVRRNLLNQVIGYRNASVGDFWTGNTRYTEQTQKAFRDTAITVLGVEAYRKLVWAERNWQSVVASVKTNIVVRSLVVPLANFVSGVYQLQMRGIPALRILKEVPKKVAEIEYYVNTRNRKIQLEAEKFANASNPQKIRFIDAQSQSLEDSIKRLSIWPLLEAGEFSTISEVGETVEDLGIGPNNIMERITQAVDKLPPGLRDAARQGYMARDTALFQALQKSVQYSDFIMKAIYFDHMTNVQKKSITDAKARITEEFNNYDIPAGRTRSYLESIGGAFFLNYKIRASKIALSLIQENPLNALVHHLIMPHAFATGGPITDNLFSSIIERTLGYSLGPGMMLQPIAAGPIPTLLASID